MKVVEWFWATFCHYLNYIAYISFSDDTDSGIQQFPLFENSHHLSEDVHIDPWKLPGPIFKPPGGALEGDGSNFTCNYTLMTGWSECSTPYDRRCWLRHLNGSEYSVSTDYESFVPTGIVREYWLTVGPGKIHADGLPFNEAKLVNNQYPGPWIQACWGDRIIVHVTVDEGFSNGTSIHWHGLRQWKTFHMDGVPGITQCPIAPGSSFTYNFTAMQYGSSWYHSHYSLQYADGLLGPISIHGPSTAAYDEAGFLPLIITDYDHASAFNVIYNRSLSNNPTILLSGRGNVTKCNPGTEKTEKIPDPTTITFESDKKYLLRLINTAYDSTFLFSIDNHELTIVSVDFVPIAPYKVDQVAIGIGQRYNVIVEARPLSNGKSNPIQDSGNYWIRTHVLDDCFGSAPNGPDYPEIGILRYNSSSKDFPTSKQWPDLDTKTCIDDLGWKPFFPWIVGEQWNQKEEHDVRFVGRKSTTTWSTYPLANFALATPAPSPTPVKLQPLRVDWENITFQHLDNKGSWPDTWVVVSEDAKELNKWVYLVITDKTQEDLNSGTGAHPIHLHGHDFAILAQHKYKYDPKNSTLDLNNPPRRDVVLLPQGGHIIIAFKTDNPGAWLMHCHIARHASEGLALQILEDRELANEIWPKGHSQALEIADELCKNWTAWSPSCESQWNERCEKWFQDDSGI